MCGISGVFCYNESAPPVDREEMLRIRDSMRLRGPDGAGLWISPDEKVCLAHRRLAIIDLSESGSQPMTTEDGHFRIVFNGEIYNYRELRASLEKKGYQFRSDSDTEVLLCLYVDRGPSMVHDLRGMYAFAIWDERNRSLFLARDPFGIKPLYVNDDGQSLRFASQVKALLLGRSVNKEINPAGHVGYFVWGSVPEPHTLYKGISSIEPGSTLLVATGVRPRSNRFTSVSELFSGTKRKQPVSPNGTDVEIIHRALLDSVAHHLIADVPVGVFLSAGIDSSVLLAAASEIGRAQINTVTLGFEEYRGGQNDESVLAQTCADWYGSSHETRWVTKVDFQSEFERLLEVMDQPSIDGVNTYFVAKAVSDAGFKVALSGLGGDELFGGYPSFRDVPQTVRRVGRMPWLSAYGKATRQALAPIMSRVTSPKYSGVLEYGGTWGGAYLLRRALFMPWELNDFLDPELVSEGLEILRLPENLNELVNGIDSDHLKVSALESSMYMRNQLLRDADWAGMAHSIEIRVPFVDVDFVGAVAPLASQISVFSKRFLYEGLKKQLPPQIRNRPKTGFSIPVRDWLKSDCAAIPERGLRGWAKEIYARQRGD